MLTINTTCSWEVSEQGSRAHAVCAKCSIKFETGELRLRPAGTRRTRLIHPHCSHGIIHNLADISNLPDIDVPSRQRLERFLSLAAACHGAAGDVPHPDVSDAAREAPIRLPGNALKHLEIVDEFKWESVAHCGTLIRHVPPHWLGSIAEAKHPVVKAIQHQKASAEADRHVKLERLWKLFANTDALLLHKLYRMRGGRKGQGTHTPSTIHFLKDYDVFGLAHGPNCGWTWSRLLAETVLERSRGRKKPRTNAQ